MIPMSMDKSLKKASGWRGERNVLDPGRAAGDPPGGGPLEPHRPVYDLPKTKYRDLAAGQSGPKRPGGPTG